MRLHHVMALKVDKKNLKTSGVVAVGAFLLTQDMRTALILGAISVGAGFVL